MNTKILYFKFTKKNFESHERNCKSKKNYENIFNNILNGEKLDKISDNNDTMDNKSQQIKKNKITCISKVNYINNKKEDNFTEIESNIEINNKEENENNIQNESISDRLRKTIITIENNIKEKENKRTNEYINKSKTKAVKNLKIEFNHSFNSEENHKNNNISLCHKTMKGKNKINHFYSSKEKKAKNNIKKESPKDKINHILKKKSLPKKIKESNTNKKIKNKVKNNPKIPINNIVNYALSEFDKCSLNTNKSNIKSKKIISKRRKESKTKNLEKNKKRLTSFEPRNLIYNKNSSRRNNHYNCTNKITITNDNIDENKILRNSKKSFNYTLNNNTKNKKLILNNTNSNINININITNINDKNINKNENGFNKSNINPQLISETNNFNNSITTVNIINNNSHSKKKLNDYKLLFYNNSKKEKYSSYLSKNSKGIEIQSININLGEEVNEDFNKMKQNNNSINNSKQNNGNDLNNIFFKKKETEFEKKEIKSEYDHFHDLEDFWSNRSQTSFSCKSGFTVSRKLRSLSRERDRIKMLNNCQKKNERDIERLGDKLLNIVKNFHSSNSICDIKNNRKSLNGIRKKYKKDKYKNSNIGSNFKNTKRISRKKKYY